MTAAQRLAHAKSLDLLTHVGQIMSSAKSVDTILSATVNLVKTMLDVERCSILILDPVDKVLRVKAASNILPEDWDSIRVALGEGISGVVARDGKALLVEDINSSDYARLSNHERYSTNSFICAPLVIKGRVIGVINANNRSDSARFGRDELDILSALAGFTALTIENARLFSASENIRARMENIVECLNVAVFTLNLKRKITLTNARFEHLLGLEHGAADGLGIDKVLPEPLLAKIVELFPETVRYRVETRSEMEFESREKGRIPLEIRLSALADATEKVDGVLVTIIDISMRREVDELRRIDEMKSSFISVVSHELRTPLTAIKGAVNLLGGGMSQGISEQQMALVKIVQNNEERLARLVSDLLDMAHIQNSTLTVVKKPTDLKSLVEHCIGKMRMAALAKGIEIEEEIGPVSAPLDQERMKQAIMHLLDNALKFTPKAGKIFVSAGQEGGGAFIRIRDTGCGISPDSLGRLFTRFFQEEHPLTRKAGGTGIGLFMVKSIVELHGGQITVESTSGAGAEFLIKLPVA